MSTYNRYAIYKNKNSRPPLKKDNILRSHSILEKRNDLQK